jgi:Mg2+ and Co2+ transporter CorA
MITERELLNLKKEIESAKMKSAELQGRLNQLHKTLVDDYKCKSVDEAESYLRKIDDEILEQNKEIEALTTILEKYLDE